MEERELIDMEAQLRGLHARLNHKRVFESNTLTANPDPKLLETKKRKGSRTSNDKQNRWYPRNPLYRKRRKERQPNREAEKQYLTEEDR